MNLTDTHKQLKENQELLRSGKLVGFTSGFAPLDILVGRLKPGTVWTVGGYSGTGKSYFILNMVEGMIKEALEHVDDEAYKRPRVVIYSTELSEVEYVNRHIHMRIGEYKTHIEHTRNLVAINKLEDATNTYIEERMNIPFLPDVVGNVTRVGDIVDHFLSLSKTPDIIFVDYVQELRVNYKGKELVIESDTMPHISSQLLKLAKKHNTCVIAVSQVNNNMANADFNSNKQSPFSYGKQLNQASDVSILLDRRRVGGKSCPVLELFTIKSRNGDYGTIGFDIDRGFQLSPLSPETSKRKISQFIEENGQTFTRKKP